MVDNEWKARCACLGDPFEPETAMTNPQNTPIPPATQTPRTSDEVIAALADFETGLTNLKQLYAQRQKLVDDILQHEREVASRESELSARLGDAAKVEEQLQGRRSELDSLKDELESRQSELATREAALREAAAEAENKANKTAAELARERAQVEEARHAIERERAAQQKLVDEINAKSQSLTEREREYHEAMQRAQTASDDAANARREVEATQGELDKVRVELTTSEATITELRQQLAITAEQMARAQAQARERASAADTLTGKLKVLQAELDAARKAQVTAESAIKGTSAGVAELNQKLADVQRRLDAAEAARSAAEAQAREHGERAASLEARVKELEASAAAHAAEFAARSESSSHDAESIKGELQAAVRRAEESERLAGEADARAKAFEIKLTEMDAKVQQAAAAVKAAKAQAAQAASAAAGAAVGPRGVSVELRRRRLRLYREAMQRQAEKIRRAGDAVKRRMEQADEVLKHRADVAAARQRVIEAERRSQRNRAASRTSVVLLCSLLMLGLLGGMSWALARQFAPATFIATAQIKADGRGRDLTLPELEEWKTFHEQLLGDPRFHETAAERFRRQGAETLGTATAVSEMVKNSVTLTSSNPGELTIALKGQGSARTERVLETLTAAWASEANEAQQSRAEGSVTQVSGSAKSGADPIDNTRNIWALGMLGAGVLFTGVVGLGVWSRLANAKTAFEKDTSLDQLLTGENWPDPESITKPTKSKKQKAADAA